MKAEDHTPSNPILFFFWIGLSFILLVGDYFSGPFIQFPVTYLVPVALASWYSGRFPGLVFAIILPIFRFYFNVALWTVPWSVSEAVINMLTRMIVLSAFAVVIARTSVQTRRLSKEVQMLEGLLPICSYCKKIRDKNEEWQPLERYISARTTATFTHGICPECREKYFGKGLVSKK